jgi:hypothetical protein
MSNYKQNKNNSWENLTGELIQIKWSNPDIFIIPINIFMNLTPYLKNDRIISKYETINYSDIAIYDVLIKKSICYDTINYIMDVNPTCVQGGTFSQPPIIQRFNIHTPYRTFSSILNNLI